MDMQDKKKDQDRFQSQSQNSQSQNDPNRFQKPVGGEAKLSGNRTQDQMNQPQRKQDITASSQRQEQGNEKSGNRSNTDSSSNRSGTDSSSNRR